MRLKKSIFIFIFTLGMLLVLPSVIIFTNSNRLNYGTEEEYTNEESLKTSASIDSVSVSPDPITIDQTTDLTVTWTSSDVNNVNIYIYQEGSEKAGPVAASSTTGTGGSKILTADWLAGQSLVSATDSKIKVEDQDDTTGTVFAFSEDFRIIVPQCLEDSDCGECEQCVDRVCTSKCGPCEICEDGACVYQCNGSACEECDNGVCKSECKCCETCSNGKCVLVDIETVLIIVPLVGIISITILIIHRKFKTSESQKGVKHGKK